MTPRRLRLATRGSPLALAQVEIVAKALADSWSGAVVVEPVKITARADTLVDVPIHLLGGQGLFVSEVEQAVIDGKAEAAVHSAKDVPSAPELNRLEIAAVLPREDPRDCLVGRRLDDLSGGALVATGSVRRRAQLAWLRPDLRFTELRGNIGTRLEKIPPGGAIVTAVAALKRSGLEERIAQVFSTAEMLPQVGQGAILVACRPGDEDVRQLLEPLEDPVGRIELEGERGFLAGMGGGCDLPVGAHGRADGDHLCIEAVIASHDGHVLIRHALEGPAERSTAARLGQELAEELVGRRGGAALLDPAGPAEPGGVSRAKQA